MKKLVASIACLQLTVAAGARADVKLPALFSDNMLLQAEKPVNIWGTADASEMINVSFAGQSASTVADAQGKWTLKLQPLTSGTAGEMTVRGKNEIRIKNVLTGSTWICSGQSNMLYGVHGVLNRDEEIAHAKFPAIRLFLVNKCARFQPQTDVDAKWVECSPETIVQGGWNGFSAVAYFFGREIHQRTGRPVGLIESSWGGTMVQSWTSIEALKMNPDASRFVHDFEKKASRMPELLSQYELDKAAYPKKMAQWQEDVNKPFQLKYKQWQKEVSQAKSDGRPTPPMPALAEKQPSLGPPPDQDPYSPATLYDGMIAPLIPYTIEGAIWYQGESNVAHSAIYASLFKGMISDWRTRWGQGDFPFYYCQLANYKEKSAIPEESTWAVIREAQRQTLALPNTGMAVLIDIGESDDIHPRNKQDAGVRLAKVALAKTYGISVRYTGPVLQSVAREGSNLRLKFDPIGGELVAKELPATYVRESSKNTVAPLVRNHPGSPLEGFAICGADRKWFWADAAIDGQTVVVSSPHVAAPVAVRYGWASNPTCNLYNKDGMPASPFQIDVDK